MNTYRENPFAVTIALLWVTLSGANLQAAEPTADPVAQLESLLPENPLDFSSEISGKMQQLLGTVEQATFRQSIYDPRQGPQPILQMTERLANTKNRVDRVRDKIISMRTQFVDHPAGEPRREAIRHYLKTTATLTELSGRLRYLSYDAFHDAAYDLRTNSAAREKLIDQLTQAKSSIGATVMAEVLLAPPRAGTVPPPKERDRVYSKLFGLIRVTREMDLVPLLASYARSHGNRGELRVEAIATIRHVGLPQTLRPEADPTLPKPATSPEELHKILGSIQPINFTQGWKDLHEKLLVELDIRSRKGADEASYRLGSFRVREGDWLLMRNPSPYNLFTDLSPGLYTHVGVVAVEKGSDSIKRFVIVDLPELGSTMPAVTVDTFVKRTLNYTFLRHADDKVGQRMGQTAASIIGNPSHFDLSFRTDGIEQLKGQELKGKKIHGYCAGLLLLCAQETTAPRSEFFPIAEHPAGGNTLANLGKLGISMGHDFLSPTGPLFSPKMQWVGGREPMFDPRRQIEQAVYDRFSWSMKNSNLVPSPDWQQAMRQKLVEASKDNPLLGKALARAAGVNENMNLVAAAKLGAVVETLDEIAYGASGNFLQARDAIRAGSIRDLRRDGIGKEDLQTILAIRQRHPELYQAWSRNQLSPRELREQLTAAYMERGKKILENRFFQEAKPDATSRSKSRPIR